MAMINVNRQTNDMFYRYKMPKLAAKVEGTGNGIKTVLVNVTAVAKALNRPPTYVTKFFGCELGAQVQMNAKEDRYIVNGAHDCEKLQNLLDGFIKRFVLCPNCDNPETTLSFRKRNGGEIPQVCAACGYQGTINMASHKLTTYIAKNPPDADGKTEAAPDTKTKGKTKGKKGAKAAGTNQDSDEGSPNEQNGKTNGASKNGANGVDDDDDDEDWGEDELTPAVAQLDINIKGMIQTDDLDKPLAERCDQYSELIEKRKQENKLTNTDVIKDLVAEAERLEIMEQAAFLVAQSVFTDNILKEIDQYKSLFEKLCTKNAKGQKYLLHAIEVLVTDKDTVREKIFNTKTLSKILLKLYDEDIVEEDTFYTWHEKSSKRFGSKKIREEIRKMANEFIQWLKTAEESSDEEDDEDDDRAPEPQIDFTHKAGDGLEITVETTTKAPVDEKIEYDGEIIDVDNI